MGPKKGKGKNAQKARPLTNHQIRAVNIIVKMTEFHDTPQPTKVSQFTTYMENLHIVEAVIETVHTWPLPNTQKSKVIDELKEIAAELKEIKESQENSSDDEEYYNYRGKPTQANSF